MNADDRNRIALEALQSPVGRNLVGWELKCAVLSTLAQSQEHAADIGEAAELAPDHGEGMAEAHLAELDEDERRRLTEQAVERTFGKCLAAVDYMRSAMELLRIENSELVPETVALVALIAYAAETKGMES